MQFIILKDAFLLSTFGLGNTVYGRITTTTVVSVDSISLESMFLEQLGYDNKWKNHDIFHVSWSGYRGEFVPANHFDFSFVLNNTELRITPKNADGDHLANIIAEINVSYLDGSSTLERRRLGGLDDKPTTGERATGQITITAVDKQAQFSALWNIAIQHQAHILQLTVLSCAVIAVYFFIRQRRSESEKYPPLLVDEIFE